MGSAKGRGESKDQWYWVGMDGSGKRRLVEAAEAVLLNDSRLLAEGCSVERLNDRVKGLWGWGDVVAIERLVHLKRLCMISLCYEGNDPLGVSWIKESMRRSCPIPIVLGLGRVALLSVEVGEGYQSVRC
jgi:hypothetical protein